MESGYKRQSKAFLIAHGECTDLYICPTNVLQHDHISQLQILLSYQGSRHVPETIWERETTLNSHQSLWHDATIELEYCGDEQPVRAWGQGRSKLAMPQVESLPISSSAP